MMTTAGDVKNADGTKNTDVLATGAGQVDPARVLDPGLVYDANSDDYLKFIQGTGVDLGMPGLGTTKAAGHERPVLLAGQPDRQDRGHPHADGADPGHLPGQGQRARRQGHRDPVHADLRPAGEKKTFKVSFENQNAALGKFAMGSLTWQGADKNVTSPIAVRPQSVVAAKDVAFTSEGGTGSGDINVVSGTNDPISMTLDGLSKADSSAIELVPARESWGRPTPRTSSRTSRFRRAARWPSSRSSPRTRTPTSTCTW